MLLFRAVAQNGEYKSRISLDFLRRGKLLLGRPHVVKAIYSPRVNIRNGVSREASCDVPRCKMCGSTRLPRIYWLSVEFDRNVSPLGIKRFIELCNVISIVNFPDCLYCSDSLIDLVTYVNRNNLFLLFLYRH